MEPICLSCKHLPKFNSHFVFGFVIYEAVCSETLATIRKRYTGEGADYWTENFDGTRGNLNECLFYNPFKRRNKEMFGWLEDYNWELRGFDRARKTYLGEDDEDFLLELEKLENVDPIMDSMESNWTHFLACVIGPKDHPLYGKIVGISEEYLSFADVGWRTWDRRIYIHKKEE